MQEQQFITLGNRIRLRRKELGLSQSKLAESLIKLAGEMVELMVARNQHNWTKDKFE